MTAFAKCGSSWTVSLRLQASSSTAVSYTQSQYAQYYSDGVDAGGSFPLMENAFSLNAKVQTAGGQLSQRDSYSAFTRTTIFGTLYQVPDPMVSECGFVIATFHPAGPPVL